MTCCCYNMNCSGYGSVNFLDHGMKLLEMVFEDTLYNSDC